jgi:hypothetical protein
LKIQMTLEDIAVVLPFTGPLDSQARKLDIRP